MNPFTVRLLWVVALFLFGAFFIVASGRVVYSAELVMFKTDGCTYCLVWDEELGGVYSKTSEGKQAPLRRLEIDQQKGMSGLKTPVIQTPTFVLMEKGKEIGRIRGYPGEEFFWTMLDDLLARARKTGT